VRYWKKMGVLREREGERAHLAWSTGREAASMFTLRASPFHHVIYILA